MRIFIHSHSHKCEHKTAESAMLRRIEPKDNKAVFRLVILDLRFVLIHF